MAAGNLLPKNDLGERLKSSEPIGAGTAKDWKGSFRGDQAFLDGGITLGPQELLIVHGAKPIFFFPTDFQNIHQHGMDDVPIVIVPMKWGAVPISAVAKVPLPEFIEGHI